MVTDEHTGVLYREGTVVAEPASCKTSPKVGGKVVDLISCGCITPTEITKDGPVMCMCGGASCNGAASLVTAASNASWFGPPSPAPENWLVAARIPPEYAPNFSGKNSGGNGSFKRRNG